MILMKSIPHRAIPFLFNKTSLDCLLDRPILIFHSKRMLWLEVTELWHRACTYEKWFYLFGTFWYIYKYVQKLRRSNKKTEIIFLFYCPSRLSWEMASCSKILTKTDTEKRLSVPIKFLESLPPFKGGHAVFFQATEESGKVWTFQCSTRKKGRYQKPVLSRGWLAFARKKKLEVGDKIEFYKARDQETEKPFYGVRVEREIKILGAVIGYMNP